VAGPPRQSPAGSLRANLVRNSRRLGRGYVVCGPAVVVPMHDTRAVADDSRIQETFSGIQ
jgi:hypothetical protein